MNALLMLVALAVQQDAPVDLDAVAAAPRNHKVILENDQVRVLQVEVAPGEVEAVHEHRWPSVVHIQSAQPATDITYEVRNGKLVEIARKDFEMGTPPPAIWVPREQPHSFINRGKAPFRLLRVELKTPGAQPVTGSLTDPSTSRSSGE